MNIEDLIYLIKPGESEKLEFKEKVVKNIHHEIAAFANSEGGTILVGISDSGKIIGTNVKDAIEKITSSIQSTMPPPRIQTQKISIDGKDILVITVEKGATLCSIGGVVYIRAGTGIRPLSIQEIIMLSSEMGTVHWDEIPMIPKEEAKSEYISWYFEKVEETRGKTISPGDRDRYLRSSGAQKDGKLTNAGILFFTDATQHITSAKIRKVGMSEEGPLWSEEYEGPVWKVIDEAYRSLIRDIKKVDIITGTRRKKIEEYPPRAIREALINAVAHRNYTISADVKVLIYPDRLEIKNPGSLMPGMDIKDPEHIPRNPSLSSLLFDTGYIERFGFGIKMIEEETRTHKYCTVEFKISQGSFTVLFRKNIKAALDEMDHKILKLVQIPAKSGEIAERLDLSKNTILRRINKLEKLGLVEKKGSGPGTRYVVRS
ncbi:MAG TPA: putative DNA binding domain-containing protein [Methanospirillum sp.]|jgi:ATP-dependent DNA helicase RecG|uniref:RNA-binding domain-containing protein n=1 Tax=Methanospirillum sp. TaxID=45200 RepID=UPI001BD62534|nr:RNA-binding domain-containing protein [Methanospirillum sp.]HPY59341.1 putative DNA binding domain-containing protein [Methanospirillum sp.]